MRKFILSVLVCIAASSYGQETLRQFVYFDYNKSDLTVEAKLVIDGMLTELQDQEITKIEIYGHTDSDGDPAANKILSENRVSSVRQYLLDKKIDQKLMVTDFFGEQHPAYKNSTEEGMRKNRRVEIAMTHIKKSEPTPVVEDPIQRLPDIRVAVKQLPVTMIPCEGDTQRFQINTNTAFTIKGNQGTTIEFPGTPFVDASGNQVMPPFIITLIEVYEKPQMVRHQLSTANSDGKMLESSGMVYLDAEANNEQVSLSPDAYYTVSFVASDSKVNGMTLYYMDSTSGKWSAANRPYMTDFTFAKNEDELTAYVFDGSKLGWINCDHFTNRKNLTTVNVTFTEGDSIYCCLVFEKYNCVMPGYYDGKYIAHYNIPVGETVKLVAYRKSGEDYYYCSKEFVVEKKDSETAVLEKMTEEEFKKRTEELK